MRLTTEKFSVPSKTEDFFLLPHLKEIVRQDMFVFKLLKLLCLITVLFHKISDMGRCY